MTYFKIIAGIDCGIDKYVCEFGYPDKCINCLSKKFSDANFLMKIFEVIEQQSEEKRKNLLYTQVWRKYQDISTIRHIIILTKGGLPALNMAVGDLPIDATLLSGFIQANMAFSSKELTIIDKINPDKKLYEFEYKNFHVLVCDGLLCRLCLILEKRASISLRELVLNFIDILEENYENELKDFVDICEMSILEPVKDFIFNTFEMTMIYPLTLSSLIPPNIIENLSLVQKAVYECAKLLLKEQSFFFISTIIDDTSKLLRVKSKEEILWNIYQMIREKIINWQNMTFQRQDQEIESQKTEQREKIFQNIMEEKNFEDIIFECQDMSLDDAFVKIDSLLKKGEIAEQNTAYQEALNEYQKALNYAKEFNLKMYIGKISFKILETEKLNKEIDIKYAIEQANKSEKKKNYVIALKYLFQIRDILLDKENEDRDKRELQKIEHRIKKIQNKI
ncbi:MAG: hypothetical protein ACFFAO_06930 [Candidatus Hermodarchaeota archaeon]